MADHPILLSREQLYELVWTRTLKSIASEYGITGTELAGICDELEVPRPANGHWSKLAHGQQPEQPPLPPQRPDGATGVELKRLDEPVVAGRPKAPDVRIDDEGKPHPITKALEKALARHSDDREGFRRLRGGFDCAVLKLSKEQRKRALLILDAVFKACEQRGYELRYTEPNQTYGQYVLQVRSGQEEIDIGVVERLAQSEHKLTPEESDRLKRYGDSWANKFDHRPSGHLTLRLHGSWGALRRQTFTDGIGRKVEDVLGKVILAIDEGFVALARMRVEHEAIARRQQEEAELRERERKRSEHHAALMKDLRGMAERWRESELLRQFLQAVSARIPEQERAGGVLAWLEWARKAVDELDPLMAIERVPKRLDPA